LDVRHVEDLIESGQPDQRRRRSVVSLEWLGAAVSVVVGALIGLVFGAPLLGAAAAVVIVGVVGLISRYAGESILLATTGGRAVTSDEVPRLHNLLDGLCLGAGLDPPQIRVVDSKRVNVAVVSTRPGHGAIVVTSAVLETFDLIQLEGVLGVAIARIRSGEAGRSARLALRLGLPVVASGLVWRRSRRLGEVLLAVVSPLWCPVFARVAPASVYLEADVAGCLMTRYPPGLIAAYSSIEAGLSEMALSDEVLEVPPLAVPGAAHLWLLDPFEADAGAPRRCQGFSHQPPLDQRITLLKEL
jgi:heat shock protein HtpX